MKRPVVLAEALGKTYKVYSGPWDRVLEGVLRRPRHREFVALSDVSFELPRGEGLGVVGENGAGKSTLLKMLAGTVTPTAGRLDVHGRIASILELGSGFHPEFTGRQNIVLNAAMIGLSPDEVREKAPEMIAFSELGDFIDQPVKTYSTGMAMRLGFAIASQAEPDVLIIDEALSVGDGYFQKKCMERMSRFLDGGGTLLFCSHAMYYVSAFCQRAVWLRHGRTEAIGPTDEVVREYEAFLVGKSRVATHPAEPTVNRLGPARLTGARIVGGQPAEGPGGAQRFRHGDRLAVEVEWASEDPALGFHVGLGINRVDEVEVLSFSTLHDGLPPVPGRPLSRLRLEVPELPLLKGQFTVYVFLLDEAGVHVYDRRILPGVFEMETEAYVFGLVDTDHRWHLDGGGPRAAAVADVAAPALVSRS